MKKQVLFLLFGAIIAALIPAGLAGQAYVIRTYKISRRRDSNEQSWQRSVAALQREFKTLIKRGLKNKKWHGSPQLIGLQRTAKTRTKNQRKIFHMQLDKIDKILDKMKRPERDKAIRNLQSRIYSLKQRMGRVK